MQGARGRAAQRTSVHEQQSDAGNAAEKRFLSVFYSAQQESLLKSRENPWAQSRKPSPIDG
jgi:hypothetical protein